MSDFVIGYRHTGIIVKNLEATLEFYIDILGLEVIQDFWDSSPYINEITGLQGANIHMVKLMAKDGTVLELLDYVTHPTELIAQSLHNVGLCHLAFRIASAEHAYQVLKSRGVSIISPPVLSSEGFAKVFFCLDPNNVRVELVEMLV